jgi:mxaD protein
VLALCAGAALAAHHEESANSMAGEASITVNESRIINAPAEAVWELVRDFDGLANWHPAVQSSEIIEGENNRPGALRHLRLANGGSIDEELTEWDDDAMQYSYRIVDGVLPVEHYVSTIRVQPEGADSARLSWQGQFDTAEGTNDEDAKGVITNVYRAGLTTVRMQVDGQD